MTHDHRSLPEHGVRRGVTGFVKRTPPDLLIGLALICVGAIPLSLMVDGYLRGLLHGALLVLVPGLLLVHLVRSSRATAYVARWLDEDTVEVEPSDVADQRDSLRSVR
jgi:hypothetical protein